MRKSATIEGPPSPQRQALRAAWTELHVAQCGFCQPGQIMLAAALPSDTPDPSDADIAAVMDGNLGRGATYPRIRAGSGGP